MTDEEKSNQVAMQCRAVAHMATALADVYTDYAAMFQSGQMGILVEQVGRRTSDLMETLGNVLNGMDANDEERDGWLNQVFEQANVIWPQQPGGEHVD